MLLSSPLPSLAQDTARLAVYRRGDPGRRRVETYIRSVYADRYDATLTTFAPLLVTWESQREIGAAAGYRLATEPLFLERYLDQPIESLLTPLSGAAPRSGVIEVGHLVSTRPGAGRRLIAALAMHLAERDTEWVVSTVTAELRQIVVRLGLGAIALAPARAERLGPDAACWGSYFSHEPIVMAGHLPTAVRDLRRRGARQA